MIKGMAGQHRKGNLKVPAVTPWFWVVKILTTAMGEATSDYLVHQINPYLAVGAGFVAFAVAIIVQFAVRRYITWVYWVTVAMVAVFGTMVADAIHVGAGVPYTVSAAVFFVATCVILAVWYQVEGTLSIHSINTRRREFFYWSTVVTTFALGTATGDLMAATFHLGYLKAALLFTALIAVPAALYRFGLNAVAAFWTAYILTRPIGASFADWLGMPKSVGALGLGHAPVCLVSVLLVLVSIGYLAMTGSDQPAIAPPADVPVLR